MAWRTAIGIAILAFMLLCAAVVYWYGFFDPKPLRPRPRSHFAWLARGAVSVLVLSVLATRGAWKDVAVLAWVFAAFPYYSYELIRSRRERLYNERIWRGLCLRCGYDLRCQHERCPECGEPLPPPSD